MKRPYPLVPSRRAIWTRSTLHASTAIPKRRANRSRKSHNPRQYLLPPAPPSPYTNWLLKPRSTSPPKTPLPPNPPPPPPPPLIKRTAPKTPDPPPHKTPPPPPPPPSPPPPDRHYYHPLHRARTTEALRSCNLQVFMHCPRAYPSAQGVP